jgi:hypothetical protein
MRSAGRSGSAIFLRVLQIELQDLMYPLRLDDIDWPSWLVL